MRRIFLLTAVIAFCSCGSKEPVEFNANNCKRNPAFIKSMGFAEANSYFSTSEIRKMGLLLIESPQPGNPGIPPTKVFQHPSWLIGGWLAPIVISAEGDIYTAPAPFINTLNNPPAKQNIIYKVDGKSGVMAPFLDLAVSNTTEQNAFGIIGMVLLCETNTLYVSSISGSDRANERGVLYAVDLSQKKIIDKIENKDVMGMGITYITGERRLFFGTGRSSDVYSVVLNEKGMFDGAPQKEFSLADLGPRGDDKVRRITSDQFGALTISGIEFNYNLIAPQEKQETKYSAGYDEVAKKWTVDLLYKPGM